MKKFCTVLTALLFVSALAAENIALVFYDKEDPQQFAIISGAKESLKDLSLRYKKPLEIKNFTPQAADISADMQAAALFEAQKAGAKGAILFAANGDQTKLLEAIKKLSGEGFPVGAIGQEIESKDVLFSLLRNDEAYLKSVKKAFPQNTTRKDFRLLLIVQGESEAKIDFETALKFAEPNIGVSALKQFSKDYACEFYSCRSYTALQNKFADEWKAFDNYGIIILDEHLLFELPKFAKDRDRSFIFCLQTAPILSEYLKNASIDFCISDDFFGYGYVSALKLFVNIIDGKIPAKKIERLNALEYTPKLLKKFTSDWIKFSQ